MSPTHWMVPGPLYAVIAILLVVIFLHHSALRASRVARVLSLGVLAWFWITATPAIGNLLVRALEGRYPAVDTRQLEPQPDGWVVVLASGQMFRPDGSAAPELDVDGWERVLTGVAVWRRVGGTLVLAGGPGHGATDSLAHVMRRIAMDAGVPAPAIQTAGGGRNTFEDLKAAAALVRSPGGAVAPHDPAGRHAATWLVTSALHMPRAAAVASSLGLDVRAVPCGFRQVKASSWRAWLPNNGDPSLWRDGLHEWMGWFVYRWRGWIH
ncbi:MAG: YdcF family protein [Rubrivivax sp.]|jgi:uncharacterized SAM-binding protein YcdF (DUF218 family)|nr:YdcF family protein [Rubrivivax sp.]